MITSYGVKGMIGTALQSAQPKSNSLNSLIKIIPTTLAEGESEDLSFLGAIPAFREWKAKRQVSIPIEYNWTLKNKKFETSLQVPNKWLVNDKTGLVQERISQIPVRYGQWVASLVADLINNLATYTAFDGKTMVSSTHEWGTSGVIDNTIEYAADTSTVPTPLEAATSLRDAYLAMLGFKDDQGELCNEGITSLAVVCGLTQAAPHMSAISENILDTGAGTVDNPLRGILAAGVKVSLIASARITGSDTINLINTSPMAAPFIFQENPGSRDTQHLDESFYHDRQMYGMKVVGNAGCGLFTDVIRVTYT